MFMVELETQCQTRNRSSATPKSIKRIFDFLQNEIWLKILLKSLSKCPGGYFDDDFSKILSKVSFSKKSKIRLTSSEMTEFRFGKFHFLRNLGRISVRSVKVSFSKKSKIRFTSFEAILDRPNFDSVGS